MTHPQTEDTGTLRLDWATAEDRRGQIRSFLEAGRATWDGFTTDHPRPVDAVVRLLRHDIRSRYRDDTFVFARCDDARGHPDTWHVGVRAGTLCVTTLHPWSELAGVAGDLTDLDAAVEVAFAIEATWLAVRDRAGRLVG